MALFDSLVVPFKQRGIVGGAAKKEEGVTYGMCVGLSVDWILRHKSNKSEGSAKRIHYMSTESPAQSVVAQMRYNTTLGITGERFVSGQTTSVNDAFRTRGSSLTVTKADLIDNIETTQDESFQRLFVNVSGIHCYYVIMLQLTSGSTHDRHATAAYHSSGKVFGWGSHLYYFDPNYGEFKIAASATAIRNFFRDLAAQYLQWRNKAGVIVPLTLTAVVVDQVLVA